MAAYSLSALGLLMEFVITAAITIKFLKQKRKVDIRFAE